MKAKRSVGRLGGKSEDELWDLYRKTRDAKIRDHFVRQYAPLVKYVAGKVAIGMPHNVEFDDLVGYGVFGLFDAIAKFDPEKHEAISKEKREELDEDTVIKELDGGYEMRGKTIKPARVVVSEK